MKYKTGKENVFGGFGEFHRYFYPKTDQPFQERLERKDIFLMWPKWKLAQKATEKCPTVPYWGLQFHRIYIFHYRIKSKLSLTCKKYSNYDWKTHCLRLLLQSNNLQERVNPSLLVIARELHLCMKYWKCFLLPFFSHCSDTYSIISLFKIAIVTKPAHKQVRKGMVLTTILDKIFWKI